MHKSQGLTFDKAIIDVSQAFAGGQVYVALSRLRSLDGLILSTHIRPSVISTDQQVAKFAQANHQPERLEEVMKSKQQIFLQQLISKTFDFSSLLKDINYVRKDSGQEAFTEETMKPVLEQLTEKLEGELGNTQNFRRQLEELLTADDQAKLLERVAKGSAYYRSFLFDSMRMLLEHLDATRQRKRVKQYVTHLSELDLSFGKKLEEVDKIFLLMEGIAQGVSKFDFEPITRQRAEERTTMLEGIRKAIGGKEPTSRKRKIGRKNGDKSTYDITLEMFKSGMSTEEIASERGLVTSTIEGHLSKAIESAALDISALLTEAELNEITGVAQQLPDGFISKDLYDGLKGKYGYGKIRAVISHIRKKEAS